MDEMSKEMMSIDTMKETLMGYVKQAINQPVDCIDAEELGEMVDMLKDFAELKRNCYEAKYYETVTKAMDTLPSEDISDERMGYNGNRYANGRYAPSGYGNNTMGYRMRFPDMTYPDNIRMGYSSGMSISDSGSSSNSRPGYMYDGDYDPRYGMSYNQYKTARRHYHETKSDSDKEEMDTHATEHLNDMISSARDIYKTATPEKKRELKESFTRFVNELATLN